MDWEPERYARNARFVAELGAPLVDLLAPAAGEHILDLGCGDGALTRVLAARGARVTGIDASPDQIRAARALGLDARVLDAQQLARQTALHGRFDAAFSNAALHWMPRQDAVTRGVAMVLRPGGRFVGELGGAGNVAHVRRALHAALARREIAPERIDPWTFPDEQTLAGHLTNAGFRIEALELFSRPTVLPGDFRDWLDTFGGAFLDSLSAANRAEAVHEIRAEVAPILCGPDGVWTLDYVRLRFRCALP